MRYRSLILGCVISALVMPWSAVHASKKVHEQQNVDPQGSVEIVNVSGSVDVVGWERPEIEVSGSAADNVERVEVNSSGSMSSVHVVTRSNWHWGDDEQTHLTIHVPTKSAVSASLVSADFRIHNVVGEVRIQTVNGDVSGEVGGDLNVTAVSGGVKLKVSAAKRIEVKTISGDIELHGGDSLAGAEASITTVSGDAKIDLPLLKRGHFKSVSGDMTVGLGLADEGQIDGESISGTLRFQFVKVPDANIDVQSFSGDIDNCFGPKPLESHYGPGSRLSFKSIEGKGNVHIDTKSGDVTVCAKDKRGAAFNAPFRVRDGLMMALLERTRFRPML